MLLRFAFNLISLRNRAILLGVSHMFLLYTNNEISFHHTPQFKGAEAYTRSIFDWRVNNVVDMSEMFMGAVNYNRSIAGVWNVSNVISFRSMFENAITFDRDVSPFDMSSAQDLDRMFYNASSFNQNLCSWMITIPQDASVTDMFVGTSCPDQRDPDLFVMPVNPLCYNDCTLDESSVPTMSPGGGGGGGGLPAPPTPGLGSPPSPTAATSGVAKVYSSPICLVLVVVSMMKRFMF